MKKSKTFMVLLFVAAIMGSCSKDDGDKKTDDYKSQIVGSWKLISQTQTLYVNGIKKSEEITGTDDFGENNITTFNADNSLLLEDNKTSDYRIEGNVIIVNYSIDKENLQVFNIVSITKTTLTVQVINEEIQDGKNVKYVIEEIFTKI